MPATSAFMTRPVPAVHASGPSTTQAPGMWASIKNAFLPDEDRHTYEEGVRRGGFLLTADVSEDQVDAAVRVLEEADTVDMDDRSQQWRSSGWDYAPAAAGDAGTMAGASAKMETGATTSGAAFTDKPLVGTDAAGDQTIAIVEEQLVVGKRRGRSWWCPGTILHHRGAGA